MTLYGRRNSQEFTQNILTFNRQNEIHILNPEMDNLQIQPYDDPPKIDYGKNCKGKNCKGKHPVLPFHQQNPECPYWTSWTKNFAANNIA